MAGVFDIDDILHGDEILNTEDSSDDTIDVEEVSKRGHWKYWNRPSHSRHN